MELFAPSPEADGPLDLLFDAYTQRLRDKGVSVGIIRLLHAQRDLVVEKARAMELENGRIAFLPVIPRIVLDFSIQLPMVLHSDIGGDCYLSPYYVSDAFETPKEPYYIYGIEDGGVMCGIAPRQAMKLISEQGRRGLTVAEVIALCIHRDVLAHHSVDAIGSRCIGPGVPYLSLVQGKPRLEISWSDSINDRHWGAASCSNCTCA